MFNLKEENVLSSLTPAKSEYREIDACDPSSA